MLVSLLRMRYILKALQKLLALDLVPSKTGGCFPHRLVLLSTGVVIVAWAITGWVDMVAVCTWVEGAVGGVGIGAAIGDDSDVGLLVIP